MRHLRFSCPPGLCGTWFVSFAITTLSLIRPIRKNNSMTECFLVFSEVIAFVCIGSQCAAVRTLLPSHRGGVAGAGLTRADRVGEASISRFARPTSRRTTTQSGRLFLPLPSPLWLLGGQPKCVPNFGPGCSPHYTPGELLRCQIEESPQDSTVSPVHDPAVMPTTQTTKLPGDTFIGGKRLFVELVLHQVHPCERSAAAPKQPIQSPRKPDPSPSVPASHVGSIFTPGSERALTIAPAGAGPSLATMETVLAELARRRLCSLTAKKRTR